MNRSASTLAWGNVCIIALITAVVVLLPLHGIMVIDQVVVGVFAAAATVANALAAHRIEQAEKAGSR